MIKWKTWNNKQDQEMHLQEKVYEPFGILDSAQFGHKMWSDLNLSHNNRQTHLRKQSQCRMEKVCDSLG